jgi:molybdenum cofactor biosynthesis enzyme MoaA
MRANNLTISINAPCNKDCSYCISKMTFAPQPDHELFLRNIKKIEFNLLSYGT